MRKTNNFQYLKVFFLLNNNSNLINYITGIKYLKDNQKDNDKAEGEKNDEIISSGQTEIINVDENKSTIPQEQGQN